MRNWLVLFAMAALLAGGCVSNSNPVLKSDQLITDPALIGKWVGTDGNNPPTIEIPPPGSDKSSDALFTADDKVQHHAVARLGKIGDLEIIEFRIDKPADRDHPGEAPYLWAIIRKADAKGVVADAMDNSWLENYLSDHPDELQTKPDGKDFIIISASTDDFQKFLLKHAKDDGAFTATHWVRPGSTTQPATAPGNGPRPNVDTSDLRNPTPANKTN